MVEHRNNGYNRHQSHRNRNLKENNANVNNVVENERSVKISFDSLTNFKDDYDEADYQWQQPK